MRAKNLKDSIQSLTYIEPTSLSSTFNYFLKSQVLNTYVKSTLICNNKKIEFPTNHYSTYSFLNSSWANIKQSKINQILGTKFQHGKTAKLAQIKKIVRINEEGNTTFN